MLSLPTVSFYFEFSPYGTSLTFSALSVVALVAADVVVVGVFFQCPVTFVAVVMVVAFLVLWLFFGLPMILC